MGLIILNTAKRTPIPMHITIVLGFLPPTNKIKVVAIAHKTTNTSTNAK